jgi:hypothetical protein
LLLASCFLLLVSRFSFLFYRLLYRAAFLSDSIFFYAFGFLNGSGFLNRLGFLGRLGFFLKSHITLSFAARVD